MRLTLAITSLMAMTMVVAAPRAQSQVGPAQPRSGDGTLLKSAAVMTTATVTQPAGIPAGVDALLLKRQIVAFQEILDGSLQQSFEQPFGLLQDIKGIYLSRYGVAFHMEVNLVPLRVQSMFDYRPYTEE